MVDFDVLGCEAMRNSAFGQNENGVAAMRWFPSKVQVDCILAIIGGNSQLAANSL